MKRIHIRLLQFVVVLSFFSCSAKNDTDFVLCSADNVASVYVLPGEPEYVKLAVNDLISDVYKITGKKLMLVSDPGTGGNNCIIIGSAGLLLKNEPLKAVLPAGIENLSGKWEAYQVKNFNSGKNYLLFTGSDSRGTMFAIYDFIEKYLGVDPMYFWTDREPAKQKKLSWSNVEIVQNEPTFKYRGWFINDEDLLTEWMDGSGKRNLDYPFYSQVANPEITEKAVEALVRLRYNLIIPASFIDIANPPEKKLVEVAAARGIFISMHHVEPMGVSAFTYFNYWKAKGKDLKFSFYSHPKEIQEVWQAYAEKWAQIPNVIWQIGLRGIADRPMWQADPSVPQSDAERGKLISDAMKIQMDIIKSVDKRKEIPVSTTLWMEGSDLNKKGFLTFPENVMVIFSDNSPGWILQPDFYETKREPGRDYGIYYHHALWGTGPHLAQGVSPQKNYEIFKLAVEHQSVAYAILNVSNIREFPMGLKASSEMLYNFNGFNPDTFLKNWCKERFGKASETAEAAYLQFFNSYQVTGPNNMVFLLDGQMRSRGLELLKKLKSAFIEKNKNPESKNNLTNGRIGNLTFQEFAEKVLAQKAGLEKAGELAEKAKSELKGQDLVFFETNFIAQQKILLGINSWLDELLNATKAYEKGDNTTCINSIEKAVKAFDLVKEGKELAGKGDKWQNWYRGDKKMNLPSAEKESVEVLELARISGKN